MKRLFYILPVLGFLGLAWFLHASLRPPSAALQSALVGKPAPAPNLPPLGGASGPVPAGRVTVVNVFASWCIPCREEAPQLAQLARARGVRLVGIAYKDKPEAATAFLNDVGNPFERVVLDNDGRAGIEWGISGVPETFVVDVHGIVRARFGPLTADAMVLDMLPAIAAASR